MKYENLGDWCKWLEKNFSPEIMIPTLPVIIRLDGNNFSKWTKNLNKPFDERLTKLMVETTEYLVKETNAVIGYTQSDEITLVLYTDNKKSSIYNNGKKQKILSKLTSKCVNFFNSRRKILLPDHDKMADFDCRIYQTPTLEDAVAQLLWRENDASRNSVLMLGYASFSESLINLNTTQVQDKLMREKGINWNDLPAKFKRGTYIKRMKKEIPFSPEEIEKLPLKHLARKNPDLVIERNIVQAIEMPIFNKVINRVGVVFNNEEPKIKTEE